MSVIRTLASTEKPLFSHVSMSAAAAVSSRRVSLNQRITRRTRSVSAARSKFQFGETLGEFFERNRIERIALGDAVAKLQSASLGRAGNSEEEERPRVQSDFTTEIGHHSRECKPSAGPSPD